MNPRPPRAVLRLMGTAATVLNPAVARQARAALVMNGSDRSFDPAVVRREFPSLPVTHLWSAVTEPLAHSSE